MNTHASSDNRGRGRGALAGVLIAAALVLSACTAKAATTAGAGPSANPSATASIPAIGAVTPPAVATGPASAHGAAPSPSSSSPPTVKMIVRYSIAATHACSWKVGSDGNLSISIGFKITASGKNPPTNVPFELTDGLVTMNGYEPVGAPFQAVLDSGKPPSANAWTGKVITAKVTVDAGQANAAHTSVTVNGPVKGVASGDTYCPAA